MQKPAVVGADALLVAPVPERLVLARERVRQGVDPPAPLDLGVRLGTIAARDPRPVLRRERDGAPPPAQRVRRTALESTALMPAP